MKSAILPFALAAGAAIAAQTGCTRSPSAASIRDAGPVFKQALEIPLNQLVPPMKERIYSTPLRKLIPRGGLEALGIYHINTDQLSDSGAAVARIRDFLKFADRADTGELGSKLRVLEETPLVGSARLRQEVLELNALIDSAVDRAFDDPVFRNALASGLASGHAPRFAVNLIRAAERPAKLIGASFVRVPAGAFVMGSPPSEPGRWDLEGPQHKVRITRDFELQQTDVTQLQWYLAMGYNPSYFSAPRYCPGGYVELEGTPLCPRNPVERVSWNDVQLFIHRLNASAKSSGTDYVYRLPTEAEWEYAARAGSTGAYDDSGEDPSLLGRYTWFQGKQTHPTASKEPNRLGLYDMRGNVWRWLADSFGSYPAATPEGEPDPKGPPSGEFKIFRGCAWYTLPLFCRSAYREYDVPTIRFYGLGFRLVRARIAPSIRPIL